MPKSVLLLLLAIIPGCFVYGQRAQDTANNPAKRYLRYDSILLKTRQIGNILPADYYRAQLPFTCDKEYRLQKTLRVPVFIRLGSLEYVNHLEGKNF